MAGKETALGQLTLDEAETFRLKQITADTLLGGVIGGEQVYHSLELAHYNQLFVHKLLPAVYLPFAVHDLDDFWLWFSQASRSINFYGFSITMPWKRAFANLLLADRDTINYMLPNRYLSGQPDSYGNTDETAIRQALSYLDISQDDFILVYGTGAMADLTLQVLQPYLFVCLAGRNTSKLEKLAFVHNRQQCNLAEGERKFSLVINCTPLGMQQESFMEITGTSDFAKAIDMAYGTRETKLISFCRERHKPHVSGEQFWKWQAAQQEAVFLPEIEQLL
jgi:shikimate 5-dehydrogenase